MEFLIAITLFLTFILLLLLEMPISLSLGISSLLTVLIFNLVPLEFIPQLLVGTNDSFTLLAIPFYILAGLILSKTGMAKRLVNFSNFFVGGISGGLGVVTIIASIFLAGISGSGPADVVAIGLLMYPAMTKMGYDKNFTASLIATSGGIGIIIPPSIALIIYGVVAETSISKLFIAGIIPGIMVGLTLIIVTLFIAQKKHYISNNSHSKNFPQLIKLFKQAIWGLLAPVIILGGIYGGIFTPTEAAAVIIVYGLVIDKFIYKELTWKKFKSILKEAAIASSVIMFIVMTASLFSWILNSQGITKNLALSILSISRNKIVLLMLMNLIVIIAGLFLDAISIFYIFIPIFLPILKLFHIDLVHFGIIMTLNLAIGQITPPIGVNLFAICSITDVKIKRLTKAVIPFIIAELIILIIITLFPVFTTGIINLIWK